MSLNLYLTVDNKPFDLWQTPTDDGEFNWELSGKKAKAAIARYLAWVESYADGVFESEEAARGRRQLVKDHINAVKTVIENAKHVFVYAA